MAKIRMSVSQEAFDSRREDGGDFVLPKPGVYWLTCSECEPGFTKTDGEEDPSKPYLKFTYKITGIGEANAETKENYGSIWDYMSFGDKSEWKRAEVLLAYGIADGAFEGELDTDEAFLNRKVMVRLKHEKGQTKDDPKQAKIARMYAPGHGPSAGGDDGDIDYGDADDVFGGADEAEAAAEPDGPSYEERKAELEGMDLKALGALFSGDYDGDPKALIVKGSDGKTDTAKTKEAVVEAILGKEYEDDGNDVGDPDDPF